MTVEEVAALFTRSDGSYFFSRWARPIVPVVFGVEEATLATVKGALEAVVTLAGHQIAATDPEQGANLMIFFVGAWRELAEMPDLDRLVPGLDALLLRLEAEDAHQYRHFRFEQDGAIRACIAFVRVGPDNAEIPAQTLALGLAAQAILLWSDLAFRDRSILAQAGDAVILRPDIAELIRVAYDPVLPVAASDPSHALRMAARMT